MIVHFNLKECEYKTQIWEVKAWKSKKAIVLCQISATFVLQYMRPYKKHAPMHPGHVE